MENKVLEIINLIRVNKNMSLLEELRSGDRLREDYGFSSFDLAELTVRIEDEFEVDIFEDGLISTAGEILDKLSVK